MTNHSSPAHLKKKKKKVKINSRELIPLFRSESVHGGSVFRRSSVWACRMFNIGTFSNTRKVINVELHDGTTHLALSAHTTFRALDLMSG